MKYAVKRDPNDPKRIIETMTVDLWTYDDAAARREATGRPGIFQTWQQATVAGLFLLGTACACAAVVVAVWWACKTLEVW